MVVFTIVILSCDKMNLYSRVPRPITYLGYFEYMFIPETDVKRVFLAENVAHQLGNIYTAVSTSSKACFDQNVKMVEILTSFIKNENPRVIQFSYEDRNIFRNTVKDFKIGDNIVNGQSI